MDIKDLNTHLQTATEEMKSLVTRQSDEIKAQGETSKATAEQITKANDRLEQMQAEMQEKASRLEEVEKRLARPDFGQPEAKQTLGDMFIKSEQYENAKAREFRGDSGAFIAKDIVGTAGSAQSLIPEFRNPNVFMNPDRPLFIRQLVNTLPAQGDAVVIMRENVFTSEAGPQFDSGAKQLVAKNKSNITYSKITVPVETMAHHFIASRQVLSDAPRLAGMINQRSVYGLNLNMDAQLLYGDGDDGNFEGLFTVAGTGDVGQIAFGTSQDDLPGAMLDHIRKAVTTCQTNEYYNINGLVVNPQDWETLELAKGSDGHYIWVTVPNGGVMQLWRVPVVVSNAVTPGDFILGDWNMGSTLYQREGISVRTSESHANLFVENGVAILAEERAAFGVELPKAYTKGKFTIDPVDPS
jgi:HK97 family phage major capsid protein